MRPSHVTVKARDANSIAANFTMHMGLDKLAKRINVVRINLRLSAASRSFAGSRERVAPSLTRN